jgi:hypothetical protein
MNGSAERTARMDQRARLTSDRSPSERTEAPVGVLDRDLVLGWMELGFGRAKKTCFRKKRTNNTHFGESKSVGSKAGDL